MDYDDSLAAVSWSAGGVDEINSVSSFDLGLGFSRF